MNLLFLIDSLEGAGAQRACLNTAHFLGASYNVTVASVFGQENHGFKESGNIRIVNLDIRNDHSLLRKPLFYYESIRAIRNLKKTLQIDCCISFLETANFFNVLSSVGEKKIVSIRNYYSKSLTDERMAARRFKAYYSAKHADKVVCVSQAIAEDMRKNFHVGNDKLSVICNMYNPGQYEVKRNDEIYERFLSLRSGASTVFISTGRIVRQKAHDRLVRAFKSVAEKHPDAKLFIIGEGDLKNGLEALIENSGLQNNVHLLSYDPAITHYLKLSDVYVSSSLFEGFSNSILEAFCNGLPIISADCFSGPRELLAPESDYAAKTATVEYASYGIIVPEFSTDVPSASEPLSDEEKAMAEAMTRLADDIGLRKRYSAKCAERAGNFTPDTIIRKWENVIDDLFRTR